ncbi:hypothetical protein MKW98_027695 [Papaver atlanticum]|uniref:Uncharacterized protein n=1 Tax=Papaver atlanticum TaxID=357466 RepID=A0AAD4TC47_9MAGN|nr:hypothetical protein MKW98_027695 [Papaver atlanticum]
MMNCFSCSIFTSRFPSSSPIQLHFQIANFPPKLSSKTPNPPPKRSLKIWARKRIIQEENEEPIGVEEVTAKGSGTTARGRRLLKVREEKRKREYDRIHNYPSWAKVLEDACKDDTELRAVLGDSIGNPELMRQRVEQRVRQKGRDFNKTKTGSVLAFKVSFRDFNPIDSHIWFELYGAPSDRDVELIGSVIQSWYVMGRLGAFNSSNLQLANSSMEHDPTYDADKGSTVMPSSFHDIGDVEFQDNWGHVWVDLGTCDFFAIDVLLNCLTVLSSEYLGIQQVVFGGRRMGDWEEGMTSSEYGYKNFKI